jgi:hypothetical protein
MTRAQAAVKIQDNVLDSEARTKWTLPLCHNNTKVQATKSLNQATMGTNAIQEGRDSDPPEPRARETIRPANRPTPPANSLKTYLGHRA